MSAVTIVNDELRNGHQTAIDLGLVNPGSSSVLTGFVCPEHGEAILHEVAQTVNGIFEAHTCPSEGGCVYDKASDMRLLA